MNDVDEALHLVGTQHMLALCESGAEGEEMKAIALELKPQVRELFREAAEQEKDWAKYLFQNGSMIGLNETILSQYVEYITNLRMSAIGLEPFPDFGNNNPIPWINSWLSSDSVQVAPQEVELSSYLVGQIDSTMEEGALDGFEL